MKKKESRRATTPKLTPEQFLSEFPPPIRDVADQLRVLVKQTLPNVAEAVYPGWRLIGYRVKESGREVYVGFIAPTPEHVALGFEYGVLLSDPHGLLEGNGNQVRYVRVKSPEDIRPKLFAELIREAAQVAALPKPEKTRRFIEREVQLDAGKRA
jgi:hypothetical protein